MNRNSNVLIILFIILCIPFKIACAENCIPETQATLSAFIRKAVFKEVKRETRLEEWDSAWKKRDFDSVFFRLKEIKNSFDSELRNLRMWIDQENKTGVILNASFEEICLEENTMVTICLFFRFNEEKLLRALDGGAYMHLDFTIDESRTSDQTTIIEQGVSSNSANAPR